MRTLVLAATLIVLSACGGLQLVPDESLAQAAIAVTRIQPKGNTISAYVVFEQDYVGPLEMRLFDTDDADGVEIGRATVRVNERVGAAYLDFIFDPRTPLRAAAAVLVRAGSGAPAPAPEDPSAQP